MRSTFMGLEASKRGLFTQQSALYTTGHNVSNANTLGYSRQRVNMEATLGYPGTGLNAPKTPGHIGTGVQAQSVQRIRDTFIDRQFRQESSKLGYWESKSNAISQMEDIMSEPSDFGLNESLDQFWKSLQDVSTNPENASSRKVAIQKGIAVAESFNYLSNQLTDIQENLKNEILVSTSDINSILEQISSINEQIQAIEPNGYMPNDLYDTRDVLIDELAQYFPIDISFDKSGGNALPIAEGSVNISIKTANGPISLVTGKEFAKLTPNTGTTTPMTDTEGYQPFTSFTVTMNGADKQINYGDLEANRGKMLSLIDSYGHGAVADQSGFYPNMLKNLDDLAKAFADEFNKIHAGGHAMSANTGVPNFFEYTNGAKDIKVIDAYETDSSLFRASTAAGEEGNGKNAQALANMKSKPIAGALGTGGLNGATIQTYYQSIIGELGVSGEQAIRLATNSLTIKSTVENNRASQSSVSLDEEMTNMIIFQQAYNANARMITIVDETLDKIINGMGRVGL